MAKSKSNNQRSKKTAHSNPPQTNRNTTGTRAAQGQQITGSQRTSPHTCLLKAIDSTKPVDSTKVKKVLCLKQVLLLSLKEKDKGLVAYTDRKDDLEKIFDPVVIKALEELNTKPIRPPHSLC